MEKSIIFLLVKIPHMYRILTNFLQINDLINNIFETCAEGRRAIFQTRKTIVKSYTTFQIKISSITVETLCDKSILNLDQQCKSLSRIK